MKLFSHLCATALVLSAIPCANAQLTKEQIIEHHELTNLSKDQLNQKASKDARNEAKRLKKEGWKTLPGGLPMERQLDRSYTMTYEFDTDFQPKYFTAEASATGSTFEAAKMQAVELARQRLAGQIQSDATALVENSVENNQISATEAESVTKTIVNGKSIYSQALGRIVPVVELYRDMKNGNKEVMIRIFYDVENARSISRRIMVPKQESK